MIQNNEYCQLNESIQRESKEVFFHTPLWNRTEPSSIGSPIVLKRQLYSNRTTYGQGKIILISLEGSRRTEQSIFTLEIPRMPSAQSFQSLFTSLEIYAHLLEIKMGNQGDEITVKLKTDLQDAAEEEHMALIYTLLRVWLTVNNCSIEKFCLETGLENNYEELQNFLKNPTDENSWINFNLGNEIETFLNQ